MRGGRISSGMDKPQPVGKSRWRFPPASEWPVDDLVSAGGDLEPSTLIDAYRHGLFPMEITGLPGVLGWWSPNPRGILPLDRLRVSSRCVGAPRGTTFGSTPVLIASFARAPIRRAPTAGSTTDFIAAYSRLHELGWAHSVEVFDRAGRLAGGLYGVRIDGLFSGESMFHLERDASKVALMALVEPHARTGHDAARCAVVHGSSRLARRHRGSARRLPGQGGSRR